MVYLPASFGLDGELQGVGYVTSLSTEGMFLQTLEPVRAGSRIRIRFEIPRDDGEDHLVDLDGDVVHRGAPPGPWLPVLKAGMGVRFADVGIGDLEHLRAFTESGSDPAP